MHHERRNMNENKSNDLQTIITQVIEEMKSEQGDKFDLNKINLAEQMQSEQSFFFCCHSFSPFNPYNVSATNLRVLSSSSFSSLHFSRRFNSS